MYIYTYITNTYIHLARLDVYIYIYTYHIDIHIDMTKMSLVWHLLRINNKNTIHFLYLESSVDKPWLFQVGLYLESISIQQRHLFLSCRCRANQPRGIWWIPRPYGLVIFEDKASGVGKKTHENSNKTGVWRQKNRFIENWRSFAKPFILARLKKVDFCQLVIERKRFPWVSHRLWVFTVAECHGPEKEDICYITYPTPKKRNKQQVMSLGPGGMISIYRTLLQDISKFSLSTRTPLWRFVGFSRDPYCMDSLGCCIRYGGMGAKNLSLAKITRLESPPSKLAGKFSAWWLLRFSIRKKSQKLKNSTIEISFWQKLRLVIYNVFHVPWMKKNQT